MTMKKLFLLIALFGGLLTTAQTPTFTNINNAQNFKWFKANTYLGIPFGITPTLNGVVTTDVGALFFNSADTSIYAWTGYQWLKQTGAGGGGGSDGNNYPVSMTFTGGTLTLNRNGLTAITTTGFDIRYLRFTDTTSLIPTKAFVSNTYYSKTLADARFVPLTRTITINGVTQSLAADRSFTVTTSEVDPKRVTGVEWSGNDSVHILTVTLADGTQFNKPIFDRGSGGGGGGVTFDSTFIYAALADTALVLRDSLNAIRTSGYLLTESDPIFTASDVFGVTSSDIGNWNTAFSWGNHAGLYVHLSDSGSMLSPYFREVGFALSKSGHIVSFDSTAAGDFHTTPFNDLRYYPLSTNPAGYLTITDAATSVSDSTFDFSLSAGVLKLYPYSTKKGADPGYAYFYNGLSNPTFTSRINLDGQLYLQSVSASSVIQTNSGAQMVGNVFNSNGSSNNLTMYVNTSTLAQISFQTNSDVPTRLIIGDNNGGIGNNTNLDIDDPNKKIAFNADSVFMRVKNGVSGTADSALIREASTGRLVMKKINTGSGTVSDFSAGDLSPLFTTSEATTTTTPALTFTLSNAAAYTVFGRASGSGAPSYLTLDSNWISGIHTQPYNDLRYYSISNPSGFITGNQSITLSGDVSGTGTTAITTTVAWANGYTTYDARYFQLSNVNNGDTIIAGKLGLGGSLIRNTTTAGNNKSLEYTDISYFHITSALNTGISPNVRGHFEFSDVDIFAYMQPGDGSQGSSLWLDYNGVGRNIWQLRSWYDAAGDESTIQGRSTDGGSHDGYVMIKQTAGNFRFKTPVSLSSSDKLASFDIAGANGFGAKMGYTSVLAPLILSGGNLYADTSTASPNLATQYFVNSTKKGAPTYIVAASNSPATLKARADYICDGTADEVEIKAALVLGNVTLVEGTYTLSSGVLMPSNRTLSGTGKATILIASGMGTGFAGTADSSTVMVGNSGSEGITVKDMTIDGNVNTKWAILFTSVGSLSADLATAGARVQNVYIKNIGSSGIELRNCRNNLIHGNVMNKVYNDGITLARTTGANHTTRTVVSNNIINGGFAAFFSTYGDTTILVGNTFDGQIDETVQIDNSNDQTVANNNITNGQDYNIEFNTCVGINVIGNNVNINRGAGELIGIFSCSDILVNNNKIMNSTRSGLRLDDCSNGVVSGNYVYGNGTSANDTYAGIYLSNSDDILVTGNTIRKGAATNKQKYGIQLTSGSDRDVVEGNNLYTAGVTASLFTANATTRMRDNTDNDGTWLRYDSIATTPSNMLWQNPTTGEIFRTAVPSGTSFTTEDAQDAVGAMINASLQYVDGTPLLAIGDRDYGPITVSGSGLTWTIDNNAVTLGNIAQVGANTILTNATALTADISTTALSANNLLGRGSSGNIAAITVGGLLSFSGTVLSAATPTLTQVSASGNITSDNLIINSASSGYLVKFGSTLTAALIPLGGTTTEGGGAIELKDPNSAFVVNLGWSATFTATRNISFPDASGTIALTSQITGTNSGTNTGDQNIFASIVVSGQTTVTTASPTQALTFAAGSNMTITTNNSTKTITFTSSGGGSVSDADYGDIVVTSGVWEIDAGVIVNADISASAAIAYSKLNLTGAILNADLAGSIAYSKLSLTGAILNADLAGSINATKINTGAVDNTEFNYLDGVTSGIQSQLNNLQTLATTVTGLTAAGTNQSTALALSGSYSLQEVTTAASGTGVQLPVATTSSRVTVVNRGANAIVVYPATSGIINEQSANLGYTLPANSVMTFIGKSSTSWYTSASFQNGDVNTTDASGALTIGAGKVTNSMLAGSISNANLANSTVTVNGTSIALGASGTVTAAAGTLTGTVLNSTVVTSSLTSVGTLTSLTMGGDIALSANNITMTGSIGATGARVTKLWATNIESTNMPTVGGTSLSSTFAPIASPTFTGTVTLPASTSFTTPVLGVATGTSLVLSSFLNEAKGADIASATTTDIGAATGNYVDVTGTTTITGLGTVQAGTRRIVRFAGALTLTHNATSLILPGAANITTVAGDVATFVSLGSGNWKCVNYQKTTFTGSGSAVFATSPALVTPDLGTPSALTLTNATGTLGASATWNGAVISSTYGGTGVNNGARTLTLNTNNITFASSNQANTVTFTNNFTMVGNFALTLTQTATTSVTLPTTGTLATLAGSETFTNKSIDASQLTGSVATARLTNIKQVKAATIVSPTASENITMFYTTEAITITEVRTVILGSSPSVTFVVNYGSTRATATSTIVASVAATSAGNGSTTGVAQTINTASIPAGNYVWITTSATSGTVNDFNINITYNQQ